MRLFGSKGAANFLQGEHARRLGSIIRLRLRSLFSRRVVDDELDEELRYHLERQIEENMVAGMGREEARRAALRDFLGLEQRKEECRDMRRMNLIDQLLQDLRFAVRQLRKSSGLAVTAILVLALGICASISIFAFVDAALIKPLPYREPSQLVGVYEHIPQCPRCNLSYLDYVDWKRLNNVFVSLEGYKNSGFIVTTPAGAEAAVSARVSDGFFRELGVAPVLGRDFYAGEDRPGAPRTVMISNATWHKRYGGTPDVVGQTVTLDSEPYVIIGVLPADFHFAPAGPAEFWATLDPTGYCEKRRSCHNMYGVARLKNGVSIESALADTKVIAEQLERQYPDSNRGQGASLAPLTEVVAGDIRPILLVLLGGAGLLLLIACVNVTSLLLVRAESRRREIGVRSALGASGWRLIRQFATEGLVLVAAGSLLGLILAEWAMRLLVRLIPESLAARMPFLDSLGLSLRVLGVAFVISVVAAVVFAITPTLALSFRNMRQGLIEDGRGSAGTTWRRLGSKLVALELTTAVVLLVGAGLLGQSLYRLLHVYVGFEPDHLATLMVVAPEAAYGKDEQAVQLGRQILSRISSLPGVKSAATASVPPVSFNGNTTWIRFVGRPYGGEHNEVNEREVSSDYFGAIGARLARGRYFTDAEDSSMRQVVIINQALARQYFPDEDPIGKQIGDTDLSPKSIREVIGIVEDVRDGALDTAIWPAVYYPFNQNPGTEYSLLIRTSQSDQSMLPALSAAIHEIDRGIVTLDPKTMRERIDDSPAAYLHRSSAWLVGAFAGVALLLSVIGLYGVIAYSVSQRTREIGVRMALGAQRSSVYRLVLKEAGLLTVAGIAAGLVCSLGVARLMRDLLFGVESWDVPTLVEVAVVLAISALLASYVPARRAASVNPVEALRAE
jgi:predicted permease